MTAKSDPIVTVGPEQLANARVRVTPELLAWFDALTDDEIAAQIAADPDAAPELDDAWFARARLVRPLKAAE